VFVYLENTNKNRSELGNIFFGGFQVLGCFFMAVQEGL
jgi:hypothetical protein